MQDEKCSHINFALKLTTVQKNSGDISITSNHYPAYLAVPELPRTIFLLSESAPFLPWIEQTNSGQLKYSVFLPTNFTPMLNFYIPFHTYPIENRISWQSFVYLFKNHCIIHELWEEGFLLKLHLLTWKWWEYRQEKAFILQEIPSEYGVCLLFFS